MRICATWLSVVFAMLLIAACKQKQPPSSTEPVLEVKTKIEMRTVDDKPDFGYRRADFVTNQGDRVKLATEHDPWADAVVSFKPGNPAPRLSTDPAGAIGPPDFKGPDDETDRKHYVALGNGGELILEFTDNLLADGPGDDVVIFEIGDAVEPTVIAISQDGDKWIEIGQAKGGKSTLDIHPFVRPEQRFRYIRVSDAKAGLSNGSPWPGADIDAVGAMNSLPDHSWLSLREWIESPEAENDIPHMYQDSNGLITVGVGKMLPDITSALRLHFVQRGTEAMATNTQIKEDYESVQKQPAALRAAQYKPFTKLDLPQKEIKKILKQDIADFKKQLKHQFPGFQSYPLTVQFALVEMAFTLGTKKLIESFPSFCKAVRDADWATAARESHRAGVSEARNLKVKNWLEEAGKAGP